MQKLTKRQRTLLLIVMNNKTLVGHVHYVRIMFNTKNTAKKKNMFCPKIINIRAIFKQQT